MSFTESALEQAIIALIGKQGISHVPSETLNRAPSDVLIKDDIRQFLQTHYANDKITAQEIESIIRMLESKPASDLYQSNKTIMNMVSDGFVLRREDRSQKDLYVQLIDYSDLTEFRVPDPQTLDRVVAETPVPYRSDNNIYKMVSQIEITQFEKRIPDGILYINGLPLVVFEFKSAVREEATIHDAYVQLTIRYKRDIPELFKYNAFCIISDGVNNKMGSFFSPYECFYAWRKVTGDEKHEKESIDSLFTLIQGMFDTHRLRNLIRNFVYFPDTSKREEKIVCRYPQYYAANKAISKYSQASQAPRRW